MSWCEYKNDNQYKWYMLSVREEVLFKIQSGFRQSSAVSVARALVLDARLASSRFLRFCPVSVARALSLGSFAASRLVLRNSLVSAARTSARAMFAASRRVRRACFCCSSLCSRLRAFNSTNFQSLGTRISLQRKIVVGWLRMIHLWGQLLFS